MDGKPAFVVANKIDALEDDSRLRSLEEAAQDLGLSFFAVSAATGEGCAEMVRDLCRRIAAARASVT